MKEKDFYETLRQFKKGAILTLKWDRGNGTIEKIVNFEGFVKGSPQLYFPTGKYPLNIDKIGGYNSIISIEQIKLKH